MPKRRIPNSPFLTICEALNLPGSEVCDGCGTGACPVCPVGIRRALRRQIRIGEQEVLSIAGPHCPVPVRISQSPAIRCVSNRARLSAGQIGDGVLGEPCRIGLSQDLGIVRANPKVRGCWTVVLPGDRVLFDGMQNDYRFSVGRERQNIPENRRIVTKRKWYFGMWLDDRLIFVISTDPQTALFLGEVGYHAWE